MARSKEGRLQYANDEILGKGNLDAVDAIFAPTYVAHIGGKDYSGPAFVKRFVGQLRSAFPDLRVVEVTPLIESGNTLAWQRTLRGTHEAALSGIPPRGRMVEWRDMLVSRFDGAQIAEEWAVSELAGQLLVLPARE